MKSLSLLTSRDFLEGKKCPNQGSYGTTVFCKLSAAFGKLAVVVKVNQDTSSDLEHEFNVAFRLQEVKARGFSKALHFFRENDTQYLVLEKISSQQSLLEAMLVMTPEQILSVVKQLIVFLWEAQKKAKFVHNDLHLNNVLITKTSMKHFVWEKVQFPTHGVSAVIIDFGFSHYDSWRKHPVTTQCTQTHRGMNPFVFNDKFDFLTLLHSVRKDCGFDKRLKNVISNMIETVGEYKFYKNFRWKKMRYSLFDLMIVMCEFPTTLESYPECEREEDSSEWKTVKKQSEKLRQEHLLSEIIRLLNPNSTGSPTNVVESWNRFRLTGVADEELILGLEFIFCQFLKHSERSPTKPFSQKNIEKLLLSDC
jgi:hypothetical protein